MNRENEKLQRQVDILKSDENGKLAAAQYDSMKKEIDELKKDQTELHKKRDEINKMVVESQANKEEIKQL